MTKCIGLLWDAMTHHIKTVYRTSEISYSHTQDTPLYGPSQGCTCGIPLWNLLYSLIISSINPDINGAAFYSICREVMVNLFGASFVDDTGLAVTSDYHVDPVLTMEENRVQSISHTVKKLQHLGQHWERLLFSTGGAINLQKSHWYLPATRWNKGKPTLVKQTAHQSQLLLTSGYSAHPEKIPQLDPYSSFQTLGVHISPSGTQT